jgi:hypothetical protein
MRRFVFLPFLLIAALFVGCGDATGIGGGRSVQGTWSGTVDREDIFLTLSEDRGQIWGSGSWGFDAITVSGNRAGSEVSLVFEFGRYQPINFQGSIASNRMDGWLTGSGFRGDPAVFWRDR